MNWRGMDRDGQLWTRIGGGRGIRTPGTLSSTTVFKTAGFNHSPIPPLKGSDSFSIVYMNFQFPSAKASCTLVAHFVYDCSFHAIRQDSVAELNRPTTISGRRSSSSKHPRLLNGTPGCVRSARRRFEDRDSARFVSRSATPIATIMPRTECDEHDHECNCSCHFTEA